MREKITWWDIIGLIADIQTSFTENYKKLIGKYKWSVPDARALVLINCMELSANARLSMGMIGYTTSNGMDTKDWWEKWCGYSPHSFNGIPNFKVHVDDKCRQYSHRIQEQLMITTYVYIESFLRNLARQFEINEKELWKIKEALLQNILLFSKDDLKPLVIYQYLRNSQHNKGIHYNEKYPNMEFDLNGYKFIFKHNTIVMISWDHIKELLIANSELLYKIIDNPKVSTLRKFDERNIVILRD